MPSWLLTIWKWPHGYSCTWPHDEQLHIDGSNEPKSAQQVKQGAQCIMKLARCDSLRLSHFCEIWALCVTWVIFNQFYYAPCSTCWTLFGSLVHEFPWGHWWIGNNREGTLPVCLTTYIYYAHLTSMRFEHSVCQKSLLTSFIMLLACLTSRGFFWFIGSSNV